MAVDGAGNVYVADTGNGTIRKGVSAAAPIFTMQPASLSVTAGSAVTFTVAASGLPVPTLQWQRGNVNISGATSASYSIGSAAAGDAGSYTVVATNAASTTTSNTATLTVNAAPAPTSSGGGGGGGAPTLWFFAGLALLALGRRLQSATFPSHSAS